MKSKEKKGKDGAKKPDVETAPIEGASEKEQTVHGAMSSAAETPTRKASGGLAAMASMHAGERPTHDAQLETDSPRRGRPSLNETPEEKKAKRNERDRKRRGLQAPEKKEPEKPALTPEEIKSKLDVSSQAITSTFIGLHAGFFGEKWKNKATGQDDEEILRSGFRAYLEAKEWYNLPPGLLLCLSLAAYYIPRLNFKALWEKMFKKKDKGQIVDEKPKADPKQPPAPRSETEILIFKQAPVGEAEGGSGAPDAAAQGK